MASFPGQKAGSAPSAPTTPSNLTATPLVSGTQILLQWSPSQDGDVQIFYVITRCSGVACINFSPITTTSSGAVNFVDSNLTPQTSYSYIIQAVDGAGNLSGLSNIATAITPMSSSLALQPSSSAGISYPWASDIWLPPPRKIIAGVLSAIQIYTPPGIPGSFTATAVSSSEIDLSWTASTDPDNDLSFYTIVRNPGNVTVQVSSGTITYRDLGLTASTSYSYVISATDSLGQTGGTASASATTQASQGSSFAPNFPRVGFMGIGTTTDDYYNNVTVTVQRLGSVPILSAYGKYNIFVLGADFEGWNNNNTRDRQVLVTNLKSASTANLGTKVLIYGKQDSYVIGDTSYQTWQNVVTSINLWTLYNNALSTPQVPTSAGVNTNYVNYAENSTGSSFGGVDSQGESPAKWAAHYQFYAKLNKNRAGIDASRFAAVSPNDAAPSLDGVQLDNMFVDPRVNADWQCNGTTSTKDNGAYQGVWSDQLIKGQRDYCDTLASLIGAASQSQWLCGNAGDYARADAGNNQTTAGVMWGVLNYSFFESSMGKNFSIETFSNFANMLLDYQQLLNFLKNPQAGMLNMCLPDGTSAQSGGLPWSTTQTAVNGEFQWARYMITATLLMDGYCAIQHQQFGYAANGANLTWYDEYDNAGLAMGYLGQAVDGWQTSIRTWYDGTTIPNVYAREYQNGLAICVAKTGVGTATQPTGTITITPAQLGMGTRLWKYIGGTQAPTVNTGAAVSATTGITSLQASRDGIVILKVPTAPSNLVATPVSSSSINLTWTASTQAGATITQYTVFRNGTNIGTATSTSFTDTGLTASTTYNYQVQAVNSAHVTSAFSNTASATTTAQSSLFLAAGHFASQKMPLNRIFPRPDSETGGVNGKSRHSLAYYDGVNPVQYECPITIQGGARPLVYQITAGPSWLNIGQNYGSAMYGVLYGTPTAAISKSSPVTVTVRVTGQDQTNFIDISFTLATSSAVADFVFTNSTGSSQTINGVTIGVGSDSTGTGSITAPFASLVPIMGTSAAQVTFPGSRCYMVGNHQWPVQSGSAYAGGHGLESTKVPSVYMTLPGASVTIDASLVQIYDAGTGCNDLYFSGSGSPAFGFASTLLTINSGPSQPPSEHTFELYNTQRAVWRNVQFTNPVSRSTDGNNCSSIMCSNSGAIKNYYTMLNVSETGRVIVTGAGSVDLLCVPFSVQNLVLEFCSATGAAPFGVYIKDSNRWVTVAYCQFRNTNNSLTLQFGGQTNNTAGGTLNPGLCEACYNYVRGVMFFDFQAFANNGQYWSYRNTIYNDGFDYGYALGDWGPTGTGPYSSESDVLISKTQAISTSGAPITATNTEVQAIWAVSPPPANMPIDPITGNLVNVSGGTQWKTLYSKTANSRGWEIG